MSMSKVIQRLLVFFLGIPIVIALVWLPYYNHIAMHILGFIASVLAAREQKLENFTVFSMLKSVEPALRALMATENFAIDGFLCPGHVATIIGEEGFRFLPKEYHMPGVIAGFEPEEILLAVWLLLRQIAEGTPIR